MPTPCELNNDEHELARFMDEGGIDPEVARQRRATQGVLEKDDAKPEPEIKRDDITCEKDW